MCGVTNEPAHPSQHIYGIRKKKAGFTLPPRGSGGGRYPASKSRCITNKEKGALRGRYPATTVNTITNKGRKGPLGVGDPASTVNTITNKEKRGLGVGTRLPNQETIQK